MVGTVCYIDRPTHWIGSKGLGPAAIMVKAPDFAGSQVWNHPFAFALEIYGEFESLASILRVTLCAHLANATVSCKPPWPVLA
jgi:hypothetical protein